MESEHFDCPVCLVQFNRAENIPKIVPCGHTICSSCLSSIFATKKERMCPLDRKSLDAEITVEKLPTNIILLQVLEAKPASEFEQCPIHKEPAKMVCMTDKCLVCKYCGPKHSEAHKDHKLVHYNEVKQKVVSKKQSLLQQLKGFDDKPKEIKSKMIDSQNQLKEEIEQKYLNIQILLAHKRILKQADTFFITEQSQLDDKMRNSRLKKEELRKDLTCLNRNKTLSNEVLEILSKEDSQEGEIANDEFESYETLFQETSKKVKLELAGLEESVLKSSETLHSLFLTEKSLKFTEENSPNLFFYQNKIEAKPTNIFLKDFLESWKGDYERFENYQSSITQWLYPNFFGSRVNPHSSKLERHEAEIFQNDMTIAENLVKSYKLALDYFGMKMTNEATGDLERTGKWALRYPHVFLLQTANHVLVRRVLAFLNNTGFRRYAIKLVDMLDKEIYGEVGGFQKYINRAKTFNKAAFDRAPLKDLAKSDSFEVFAQYGNHYNDPKKIEILEKNCFSVYPEGFADSIYFQKA